MKALQSYVALIVIAAMHHGVGGVFIDSLCPLFKNGTQLRVDNSCDEYIVCHDDVGIRQKCPAPMLYDRTTSKCVKSDDISICDWPDCNGANGKWVADPLNCNGFLYCTNGIGQQGYCTEGYHFSEAKQMCVFADMSACKEVSNLCNLVPDGTQYRDESSCSDYFKCSKGKPTSATCKSQYYDKDKGCVDKALVQCDVHTLPKNVCGTDKNPSAGFKSDKATCRGYFYCKDLKYVPDLEPVWGQCPEGLFFDQQSASCRQPKDVGCTYNRCEGRGSRLVSSATNNCRDYIICVDGRETEKHSCPGDLFFDEDYQACVRYIIEYPCCDGKK